MIARIDLWETSRLASHRLKNHSYAIFVMLNRPPAVSLRTYLGSFHHFARNSSPRSLSLA